MKKREIANELLNVSIKVLENTEESEGLNIIPIIQKCKEQILNEYENTFTTKELEASLELNNKFPRITEKQTKFAMTMQAMLLNSMLNCDE